ncbi:hypothetical protein ACH5RR_009467 [Cinchona calisaya]|uniref:PGG domain-containing protein n=1 Tax=Cinchona calisaya TaxID=153742 RepID=A0ABD3AHN4_9GENT
MEQSWMTVAQSGNIDALYELFGGNPNLLEEIDKVPFIDTPMHLAASAGHTDFAIEVLRLKPSFGKKPNPDGFIPLVLALRNAKFSTVSELVTYDPELIRVKGKLGFTPLHYVAEAETDDYVKHLEEFLLKCPESIEDLTIQQQTAVHIAVSKGNIRGLNVLLGWLKRTGCSEKILKRKDNKGDTLLHVAASINNSEIVRLLIKDVDVDIKNLAGSTALDISSRGDERIREILSSTYYMESFKRRLLREFANYSVISMETVNALLVVAALITTATYQALLSPPGGISSGPDNNSSSSSGSVPSAGKTQMGKNAFYIFLFFNSAAFLSSMAVILVLLKYYLNNELFLNFSVLTLLFCYGLSAGNIKPDSASTPTMTLIVISAGIAPSVFVFLRALYKSFGGVLQYFFRKLFP